MEASISVEFQSIRLLLGPLIISARGLEIWTQTVLASTRTKSCKLKGFPGHRLYAVLRDRYGRKEPTPDVVYVPDTDDPALVEALALSLVTADAEGLAFALRTSEEEKVELAEKGVLCADDGGGVAEEKIEMADL